MGWEAAVRWRLAKELIMDCVEVRILRRKEEILVCGVVNSSEGPYTSSACAGAKS